jgi:hypothetical protein
MLDAFRVTKLIDGKPSVEQLNRYDEVQKLLPAGYLTAPISQAIIGEGRQLSRDQELFHRAHLTHPAGESYPPEAIVIPFGYLILACKIEDRGSRICYDKLEGAIVYCLSRRKIFEITM